jgi:hypothetical protein
MLRVVAVVIAALAVTAVAAASPDPREPESLSGRALAQQRFLIPGGELDVDNAKKVVPWGRSGNVWQTTTRNIVCRYLPATTQIRCMTRDDGFTLALRKRSIWTYDDTVSIPRSAPVLRWGQYLKRGPFRCISRRAYLSCFNLQTKRGFELNRTTYSLWNWHRWCVPPGHGAPWGNGTCRLPVDSWNYDPKTGEKIADTSPGVAPDELAALYGSP